MSKIAEKELGQPIICENKAGGGGAIAKSHVLKSKGDGYTLGVCTTATNINTPHMQKVPYNPLTDLKEVMVFMQYTHALCVRSDSPWNTFEDVLAYARQNPGKFTYGAAGIGVTQHIAMERIAMKEKIKWSIVPFKSGSEPVIALLGGHVNAAAQGPVDVIPHIQAGKLRFLLSLNDVRWPIAPNIPSMQEKYGFFGMSYESIYAPVGIAESVREKLEKAFKNAMNDPAFIEAAKAFNVVTVYMGGKEYEKMWKSHYEEMGKIIRELGLAKQ